VEGVKEAVLECPYFQDVENIEYILESVSSDISDMPLTIEETMTGARNRAQNVRKK
jgi:non-canonical (house-cleaning) NTP pyrophosphatase